MEQIQHEGAVQGCLTFLPERVVGVGVLGGGVADKVADELQHVGVAADIAEWVVAVGAFQIHQVKNFDHISLAEQQGDGVPGQFSFWIGADIGGVGEVDVGLDHIPGLAGAAAAHHNLQKIPLVFPAVQAHADMLGEDDIVLRVFILVFAAKLFGVAPVGGAVFLSRPPVLTGGLEQHHGKAIEHQGPQQKLGGVGRPLDGKGAFQQSAETPHEVKHRHAVLIAGGQERRQIEDGDGQQHPGEDAAGVRLWFHRPRLFSGVRLGVGSW